MASSHDPPFPHFIDYLGTDGADPGDTNGTIARRGDDIDRAVIQTGLCEVTSSVRHKGFDSF